MSEFYQSGPETDGIQETVKSEKPLRPLLSFLRSRYHFFTHSIAYNDRKANIMVRLNSLILSGVIVLFKLSIEFKTIEIIALMVLMVSTLVSLTYATLAAQPIAKKRIKETGSAEALASHLFDYKKKWDIPYSEFKKGFDIMRNDTELIYDNMSKDLFQISGVINQKYKLLRSAYISFRIGLAFAALFLIAVLVSILP